jgi:hypothetical protein
MNRETPPERERLSGEAAFRRLAAAAADRGLTLLSAQWQGASASYLFRCSNSHQFERRGTVILRGTATCLECVQQDMQVKFLDILRQREFVCKENAYLGSSVRQHFACRSGHTWETQARKIMEGSGCPHCAAQQNAQKQGFTDGLDRLRTAAAAHGGKFHGDTYLGMKAMYEWECSQGHRWRANGHKVTQGSWCRMCFARRNGDAKVRKDGLARLKAAAESHGGQCLDDVYVGSNAKYRFRCAKGHEWQAHGHLVLARTWCERCAHRKNMLTIEQMREIANERGGRCLSEEYFGNKVKLTWECSLGHVWQAMPHTVIYGGTWCPNCYRLRFTRNLYRRRRYDIDG